MTRYFCDGKRCLPVIGNVMVYRDPSHITATYAKTLAPMLLQEMSPGLPDGWAVRQAHDSSGDRRPAAGTVRDEPAQAKASSRRAAGALMCTTRSSLDSPGVSSRKF
jgi:hypothetical protein